MSRSHTEAECVYVAYVAASIDAGLRDVQAERTVSHAEALARVQAHIDAAWVLRQSSVIWRGRLTFR